MTKTDGRVLASRARLRYVSDDEPGIRRVRRGKGFSYHDQAGNLVEDAATKEWIASLVVPPAWDDVWISPHPGGHILATGRDAQGRKQYIYHPEWERVRDEVKFARLGDLGKDLPEIRRAIHADLTTSGLPAAKVTALVVTLLDRTLIRVGNRRYADENEAYGLTTLANHHAEVEGGHIRFSFTGKSGKEHEVALKDRRLARLVAACQELDGQTLFSYRWENGTGTVTSNDVNEYLQRLTGTDYTAKDFRTWGGTTVTAWHLARSGPPPDRSTELEARVLEAIDAAADRLGNTRAIARDSYVHPSIPDAFRRGEMVDAWKRARPGRWLSRPESLVRILLS